MKNFFSVVLKIILHVLAIISIVAMQLLTGFAVMSSPWGLMLLSILVISAILLNDHTEKVRSKQKGTLLYSFKAYLFALTSFCSLVGVLALFNINYH